MANTRTATIERYHVRGTPNFCLALYYRGGELTPLDPPALIGHRSLTAWIPADDRGVAQLRHLAKKLGFTHVRIDGDWQGQVKPSGGKL